MAAWHDPPSRDTGIAARVCALLLLAAVFGLGVLVAATMILDAINRWPK